MTTTEQLKSYFQQFGAIESCTTVQDRFTGQSRCFGFIITDQKETANKILSRIHQIDGKTVECKPALPKLEGKGTIKERKIFVGGLCTDVTDGEFRDFFEKYGKLEDCIVMRDKESGRPRGFGFITFSEEKAARKVIYNYHHNRIRGNWIDCKKATPKLKIRKLSDRTPTGEDKNELMTGFEKITTDLSLQNCSADELPSAASIERYIEKLLLDDDL